MFDPLTPQATHSHYLHERYRARTRSPGLGLYYRAKPAIPRSVQVALRRGLARRQTRRQFPAWPIEPLLIRDQAQALGAELAGRGVERMRTLAPWPDGNRFAVTLTHDVEGPAGIERIPAVLDVERRHGFVSSWNFVAEDYPVAAADLELVRSAGCEVGVHGLTHDAQLFGDRASFLAGVEKIRGYLDAWGAVGFRSPSTFRNAAWMHELPVLYDSSFPDTDPIGAQPGGCCWIFPFFFGEVVELPITLDQDYTLFVLLRERSIERWTQKSTWLIENHGLINVIVHPDYMTDERLALYEEFLEFLKAQERGWHALPREVAHWWRERAARCVRLEESDVAPSEQQLGRASTVWTRVEQGRVVYEL